MICTLQAVLMLFKASDTPVIGVTSNSWDPKTTCIVQY
jgi:hypothetical protein